MKRVTIWGTSLKKAADEAQLIAHYQIIKTIAPDAEVTLLTYPRRAVQEHYPQLRVIPIPRLYESLPAILRSDLFVLAGGPLFDDTFQVMRTGCLILFVRLVGVPILIYGVTGFPIRSRLGKWVYRWVGNQARRIVTRDSGAHHALEGLGVKTPIHQGTDLRVVLRASPRERIDQLLRAQGLDPSKPLIGFTVRYIHENLPAWVKTQVEFNADTIQNFNRALGELAAELSRSAQVFILAMNPSLEEDLAVMENMQRFMPDPSQLKIVEHRHLAIDMLGMIAASDLLIAGRVGSAFFSTLMGTPLIAISHETRMNDWMAEIGMDEYCFDWHSLDADAILNKIMKLRTSRDDVAKMLQQKAASARQQAWQDAEAYRYFLLEQGKH